MKWHDMFFIVSNVYLASALSGRVAAYVLGIFYGLLMFYYMWRDK